MSGTLEIEDVFTAYDKADVLQGVSLKVEAGRITCLLGSNGSGKTTLVRSILGLTPARVGRIVFDDWFGDIPSMKLPLVGWIHTPLKQNLYVRGILGMVSLFIFLVAF